MSQSPHLSGVVNGIAFELGLLGLVDQERHFQPKRRNMVYIYIHGCCPQA